MIEPHNLILFFLASLLLALAPGPDNLFVLAQSAQHGRRTGLTVTLGLCTGLLIHTSAVALGVAAIFRASALAFDLLKYIGAAYLLYLAWQAFHAQQAVISLSGNTGTGFGRLYRRGIIMNVTNPKVSIFFLAYLPQFTDPEKGGLILQMFMLGFIFITATILVFGGISLVAGAIGEYLRQSTRVQKILDWLAGTIFTALAIKLAVTQRT